MALRDYRRGDLGADRRACDAFRRGAWHMRHVRWRGRRLRAENPHVRLLAVQPDGPYHALEGVKHLPTTRWCRASTILRCKIR